jgi:hypothetical protein
MVLVEKGLTCALYLDHTLRDYHEKPNGGYMVLSGANQRQTRRRLSYTEKRISGPCGQHKQKAKNFLQDDNDIQ